MAISPEKCTGEAFAREFEEQDLCKRITLPSIWDLIKKGMKQGKYKKRWGQKLMDPKLIEKVVCQDANGLLHLKDCLFKFY